MQPDERVGVEQDHSLDRPPLNASPSAVQSHVHCPRATSGSIDSIIFCRPPRRGLPSGRITNRTPRRSMTAGRPCSAASRRSENRARASATEYRFICPLYIGGHRDGRCRAPPSVRSRYGWTSSGEFGLRRLTVEVSVLPRPRRSPPIPWTAVDRRRDRAFQSASGAPHEADRATPTCTGRARPPCLRVSSAVSGRAAASWPYCTSG